MTVGSVGTSITLQTPLSIDRSRAGLQVIEALDALTVAPQRLGETVVANPRERAGDVAPGPEELVLLVADVTPPGVVRDDHHHRELVAHRGGHLHGAEPERAVPGEQEDPLVGSRRLRGEGEGHPDTERSERGGGGEQAARQFRPEVRQRPREGITAVGDQCRLARRTARERRRRRLVPPRRHGSVTRCARRPGGSRSRATRSASERARVSHSSRPGGVAAHASRRSRATEPMSPITVTSGARLPPTRSGAMSTCTMV